MVCRLGQNPIPWLSGGERGLPGSLLPSLTTQHVVFGIGVRCWHCTAEIGGLSCSRDGWAWCSGHGLMQHAASPTA